MNDFELIQQILAGQTDNFSQLIDRHQHRVARIVASHVPGDRVDEVAHEVFIRAYKSLKGYKPKAPFENWLSTIAARACHDFWRRQYRRKETNLSEMTSDHQSLLDAMMASASQEEFEKMARQRELQELLENLLADLAPMDRMVLTMTYLEERTVKETAELLGISVPNVKVRSFRARKKLKALLDKQAVAGRGYAA